MFDGSLELIDFKKDPEAIGSNAFMNVNDCVVRAPSIGILDDYSQDTIFSYIDTSSHIVRLTSTNAPDTVTIPDFVVVKNGMKLSLPSTIKTQGYDIRMTADGSEIGEDYVPTADVTIVLDYWIQSYTVNFTVDGETYQTYRFDYGKTVTAPTEDPVKEQDERNTYEFTGWKGFTDGMTVTGDMTFEAQFQVIPQDDGSGDDTMLYAGAAVAIVIVIILALLLLRRFL